MRTTILLFLISTIIVYGAFLLPQTLHIEEKIKINSSSSHISESLYNIPKWKKTSSTKYIYSQFQPKIGAFMTFKENEKAELYIQSISNKSVSNSDFQKLKDIANFKTSETQLEGEFELKSAHDNNAHSTLHFIVEIDLGENPFVRYLAYFYYKPKIENEANTNLERLKKLCENPIFCKK